MKKKSKDIRIIYIIFLFLFIPLFASYSEYKWEKDTTLFAWSKTFLIKDSSNNYYYSAGKGPYISTDNMRTWKEALLLSKIVYGIGITPNNRIIITSDSIFYSDDFGNEYYTIPITTEPYDYIRAANLLISNDAIIFISYWNYANFAYTILTYSTDNCQTLKRTITKRDTIENSKDLNRIHLLIGDRKNNYFYFNYYTGIYHIPNITDTLTKKIFAFEFEDPSVDMKILNDTTLLLLYNGQLKYTNDQGKNWFDFPNQPSPFYTIGTNRNKLLAVDGPNCWLTSDFGNTWEIINDNASSSMGVGIPLIADNDKVLIVKPNVYVYKGELITDVVKEKIEHDFEVSPNPATDFIEIAVGKRHAVYETSEVKIIDVLGEIQTTPSLRDTPPWKGGEKVRINVSGLAPGMYFVRIGDTVQKFIKI